ncbi:MAG TPA: HEAT repeat domain-containing protein, partial [Haliangium sp.]|nr:HEAT repeat domain-containing protein [Haliangium sp.]
MIRDPDDSDDLPGATATDSNSSGPSAPGPDTASDASAPGGRRLPPRRPRSIPPEAGLPAFDERRLYYAELAPHGDALDADEIAAMLTDGRAIVRANAALAFAAMRQPSPHLVSLLRDSDVRVALAAAEALGRLGPAAQDLIPAMIQALGATQPQVTEAVMVALSDMVGRADAQLIAALDVPHDLAQKTVVAVCGRVGKAGVRVLIQAAGHERSRIRINAVTGLGSVGQADADAASALLARLELHDPVPDIRAAAKKSMLALIAPGKQRVADDLPKDIPDFEERNLAVSELAEYADAIDVDAMIRALPDGRKHVRINAARALGVKGEGAGRAARPLALLLRDSVAHVRREAARALGRLGQAAPEAVFDATSELVAALGDAESEVAEAASATLAALGERALDALVRGLETGDEAHARRVVELIGALPQAAEVLTRELASPAVNVQVNAALGLGLLGPGRVGPGRKALLGARTGGFARTREAVRRALEMLDGPDQAGPRRIDVDGFETRFLAPEDLAGAGLGADDTDDLIAHLQDGRDVVRANAATALGALGERAATAARPLGVRLRDDSARVRRAAAQAIGALGDAAVRETAADLVGALRDGDAGVAEACAAVLGARTIRVLSALLRGLETDDETHARRILALIHDLDDASDILRDAFESPAVNVQVNAALGLGLLGPERVGAGRKALE